MAGFCEVALPVPLRTTFTYRVPSALDEVVVPGARVVVPFRNRAVLGVITSVCDQAPHRVPGAAAPELKEVAEVVDSLPALPPTLVELGRWVSDYYLAPIGETFRALLPPSVEMRFSEEWRISDSGRERLAELRSFENRSEPEIAEKALLDLCDVGSKSVGTELIRKLPGGQAAAARLRRRGQLAVRRVAQRRAPRMQKILAWRTGAVPASRHNAEVRIQEILVAERGPLPLPHLLKLAAVSRSVVDRLAREGKLQTWDEPVVAEESLFETDFTPPSNVLSEGQQSAVNEIVGWLNSAKFVAALLYGVTGSGKTEVYLRAVEATLARGKAALVLVPEIALTLWAARLCRARFGESVAILHSGLSDAERAREWWRVRSGEVRVIVGTRSAVFAPLENVGLLIVDEEQESSYKQEEAPRYNGRDVAVVRAQKEGAVVLLASATPSLESFHHASSGKYQLLRLEARIENRPMARVEIVDMRKDFRQTHRGGEISERLRSGLAAHLAAATQSLVLINRRGYSWFALCRSCGASVLCENCSIALTYHKRKDRLICHYCGFSRRVPKTCPKCSSEYVYFVGAGSEQMEERLRALFPDARIARLDRDTARSKRVFEQVLGEFASGGIDILVGTQMVAKGHDFQRVTLVGVVSADAQLGFPDFRAAERTFQLLTQVAGRAGRGTLAGEVLVETHYPEHYAIQLAAQQDYPSFFEKELQFRRLLHYPPFSALATLLVRDTNVEKAIRWSRQIASFLEPRESRGIKILGPAEAPLARIKREYRFQFLLKSPKRAVLHSVLAECLAFCSKNEIPDRAVLLDVDPLNFM